MASLRRTRTMPTDGAIAKFLYTILKQLDLKSVNWSEVASSLEITNGHAARMRFSRFRQQMEGIQPKPQVRKPRPTAHRGRRKNDPTPSTQEEILSPERGAKDETQQLIKTELGVAVDRMIGVETEVPPLVKIKPEATEEVRPEQARTPNEEKIEKMHRLSVTGGIHSLAQSQARDTSPNVVSNASRSTEIRAPLKPDPMVKEESGRN